MDFFKKSTTDSTNLSGPDNQEFKKGDESTPNSSSKSCLSAFRVFEATVEGGVNSVVSGGEQLAEGIKYAGKKSVELVEEGAKIVKDGVDLTESGVGNITRLIKMCQNVYYIALKYRCFIEADSILESTIALALWIFMCYIFQTWMIPATILMILIKNYIQRQLFGIPAERVNEMLKEENDKSLREKLEAIEQIIVCVKNIMGQVELLLGKTFEVFDVYLPQLFWIVVLMQIVLTAVLMYIPMNYMLMFWGISLYMRRFFNNDKADLRKRSLKVIPEIFSLSTYSKVTAEPFTSQHIQVVGGKAFTKHE